MYIYHFYVKCVIGINFAKSHILRKYWSIIVIAEKKITIFCRVRKEKWAEIKTKSRKLLRNIMK